MFKWIWIYETYIWTAGEERPSQLFTQLKQSRKESLKKIQDWTGFLCYAGAVSTNWTIKPTGSWQYCDILQYTREGEQMNVNISVFTIFLPYILEPNFIFSFANC